MGDLGHGRGRCCMLAVLLGHGAMQAFVEHLSGVIRVGAECDRYGKPFEVAVAFSSIDGRTATIKALVAETRLTHSHASAIIAALASIGLEATWDRIKAPG